MATPLRRLNQPEATPPFRPDREYVASTGLFTQRVGSVLSALFGDEAEVVGGADVYERMATDPEVKKCLRVIVDGALADGVEFYPSVADEEHPDYALAKEISDFCELAVGQLRRPLTQTLKELVRDAATFGHKVAEVTYKDFTDPEGRPRLVLDCVKLKPRDAVQFVVDEFMNELGMQAWRDGRRQLVPREKFLVLAFDRKDEDPRGRSLLRPAYNWWTAKRAALPIYLKRMEKKAIPSTVGFTSDKESETVQEFDADGAPLTNENGDPKLKSSAEVMAVKLAALENGSAAAFPAGAKVEVLDVQGNGVEFSTFFELCDSQISNGILHQKLATSEGKYGTRAQGSVHMSVLDLLVWAVKGDTADQVRLDLLKPLAYYNYGAEGLRLLPFVSLGDTERRDWAEDAGAANELAPNLTDSQWLAILKQLGIPSPEEGEELPPRARVAATPASGGETGDDPNASRGGKTPASGDDEEEDDG
jgi:hypothetical protein